MKTALKYLMLATALLGACASAQKKAPAAVLVKNATIWTVASQGTLQKADLLVENGKIAKVGTGLTAPSGAIVIDAAGKHVTPGMIDCHSHTAIRGGVNEGSNNVTAEVRILDVVNPEDINIYRQLAGGTTLIHALHGSANSIGGQNAPLKLRWHSSAEEMRIEGIPGTMKFALGENPKRSNSGALAGLTGATRYPNTRMGVNESIRERFTAARDYLKEWDDYNKLSDKSKTVPPRRDLQLEAIGELLTGTRLIHSHSYVAEEILALLRLTQEFHIQMAAFQHVLEGYKVADELAAAHVGASTFSDWWAYKMEAYDAISYNGAIMNKKGVVVSFNSDDDELARRLNLEDAKAVRWGDLTEEEAIKFNTINPAIQLRMDKRTGSLEPGKDADFVIWSGHPLSVYSIAEQTWVDGVKEFDRAEDLAARPAEEKEREDLIAKVKASDVPPAGGAGRGGRGGAGGGAPGGAQAGRGGQAGGTGATAPAASTLEPRPKRPTPAFVPAEYKDKLAPTGGTFAIVGATIHTVSNGDIANGTIVFSKGKITALGPKVSTAGATIINGAGKHVYPGMIQPISVIGISEVSAVAATLDEAETGVFNPNATPYLTVNADSELLAVARTTGITHVNTTPMGGIVSGTSSLTRLDGWNYEDMSAVQRVALQVHWPAFSRGRGGRGGGGFGAPATEDNTARDRTIKAIRQWFDDARAYEKAKNAGSPHFEMDTKLEALLPVIDGKIPVIVYASEPRAIKSAVTWAQEEGVRPIIAGGGEIWRAAAFLKENNVPVILTGVLEMPTKESDPYDEGYTVAAKLQAAGVKFCIADGTGGNPDRARDLPFHAGMAAAFGLPKDEALKAVTLYPAQILGVGDQLGSLEVGKSASLIVTSGDPLEIRTKLFEEYIDGRKVNLEANKQYRLYQKYMNRPKPMASASATAPSAAKKK